MRSIMVALLLLVLTACGASPATGDAAPNEYSTGGDTAAQPAASPAASPAEASASEQPAASPAASDSGITLSDAPDFQQQATDFLARTLNVPADQLTLQSSEEVEWSDGALGCPKPGMMYTQALVPGFKLTYTDGTRTYDIHTDNSGNQIIWCNNGQPQEIGQP